MEIFQLPRRELKVLNEGTPLSPVQCPLGKETNALDTQQHSPRLSYIFITENSQHYVKYEEIFFSEVEVETAKTSTERSTKPCGCRKV